MKQILHILRKDLHRFWIEIAISVALLVVFTWIEPKLWSLFVVNGSIHRLQDPVGPGFSDVLLMLLIPISWWLFIARAVHEERLVGDRQFWITRPYEWQKLLAAKALLVVCLVYVPLAASQWWLLQASGLQPATHIGALLYDWLLIAAYFTLPIAALAAVTRNFARMTLTLLGVFVAAAAVAAIISALLQNGAMQSPVDHLATLDIPLLLLFCSAVLLLSYARRRIALGRVLLLVLPVLLLLSRAFFSSDAMINQDYPESHAGIQFSLRNSALTLETAHVAISPRQLYIQIPLNTSGIAPGDLWVGKGVRIKLEAGGRSIWVSHWQPLNFYLPANGVTTVGFNVDRAIYDRVQSETVTLRLEIALDEAHREQLEASQISLHDVEVPRLGICSAVVDPERSEVINGESTPAIGGLACRSALRDPQLTYAETAFTRGPCQAAPGNPASPLEIQGTWIGSLNDERAETGIGPIKIVPLLFSGDLSYYGDKFVQFKRLCPGAPITFTRYGLVRHLRTELTLENFQFPSYDKREDSTR
jgi:hypothetical protein